MTLIHIGDKDGERVDLLLEQGIYCWYSGKTLILEEHSLKEAMRLAYQNGIRPRFCGTRFSLPERDEHGAPALFCEMKESLASSNGIYFDKARGHFCIVKEIPLAARKWA